MNRVADLNLENLRRLIIQSASNGFKCGSGNGRRAVYVIVILQIPFFLKPVDALLFRNIFCRI
jgi:hypothetical protein